MESIFLKAAPGRRVKDPVSMRLLAEDGELKPKNVFWCRRLIDGDVIEAKPPSAPHAKPHKSKAKISAPAEQAASIAHPSKE